MRSLWSMFRSEDPDFVDVDEAQVRARAGLREAQNRQVRATYVSQRSKWSRDTNHFSEGMKAALAAPPRASERKAS